ncbi:MAG: FtsQ-type POTRA domain-containing protein [Pseudomonadota bacterium]
MRAVRYGTVNLLRLAGFAFVGLVIAALGLTLALGRFDDFQAYAYNAFDQRLADAGMAPRIVDLVGAEHVDAQTIAFAIDADPGRSLMAIDPHAARANVEALGWVETASVSRLWPDRVSVVVTEREPFALWQLDGAFRVIDRSGVVIEPAQAVDYADLPRVVGEGAAEHASAILSLVARQPEIAALTTHAVRVGERRWNLRLEAGGDILLPEDDPASALATIAALHEDRGVLHLDAAAFDIRTDGRLVIRAWPDRAEAARGEREA